MFHKITSKKEMIYIGIVVGLTVATFSLTKSIYWLYLMAFLLFLSGIIFRKWTKKDILKDFLGAILLSIIFLVLESFRN